MNSPHIEDTMSLLADGLVLAARRFTRRHGRREPGNGACKSNGASMLITYRGKTPKVHSTAFIAPTAVLIGDVEIGEEASVWFGTIIRGDNGPIRIGARSNVQDNAVVHVSEGSQTIIGEGVTIGHCAVMEDCVIGDGALIGSNAVILNFAKIGKRALIAAGSVVGTGKEIPAEVVAAGAPAVVKKPLDGAAINWVDHGGPEYVHLSRSYLEHGIGKPESP